MSLLPTCFIVLCFLIKLYIAGSLGFPGSSVVKNPPVMKETRVQFLDWEDPLEEGMATHLKIFLPGESHGQRSHRALVHKAAVSDTTEAT